MNDADCIYCHRVCPRCGGNIMGGFEHIERPQATGSNTVVCGLSRASRPLGETVSLYLDHAHHAPADTPTLVNVGVNYCTVHHGIANEDDGPVCDFAGHNRRGSDAPCDLRPLGYVS